MSNKPTFYKFNGREGMFVSRVDENTPGAVSVENEGKVRHELHQNHFKGVTVKTIQTRDDEFNGQPRTDVVVRLAHEKGPDSIVHFNAASQTTAKLVAALHAADLSKPLDLSGQLLKAGEQPKGFDKPLGKDMVALNVFQEGKYVKPELDIPKGVEVAVGSKKVLDTSERDKFVLETTAKLAEKLAPAKSQSVAHEAPENAGPEFPDARPGHEMSGPLSGPIVEEGETAVVQDLGRQSAAHEKERLDRVPAVGENVRVTYQDGRGQVQSLNRGQQQEVSR